MPNRAAILFDGETEEHGALLGALTQVHQLTEVRSNAVQPKQKSGQAGSGRAWWLATYRPGLVVSAAQGPDALLAALYRMLFPRTRLLVRLRGPGRGEGPLRRLQRWFVLGRADAVLADDAAAGMATWGQPVFPPGGPAPERHFFPLAAPGGLDAFLACPLARPPDGVRRIAFVGPLSPSSGATDILRAAAAWSARNEGSRVEIWWMGEGDLAGILDAQPLPEGMSQTFLGAQDRAGLVERFAQCGLLVLPLGTERHDAPVAEALAAGLPVFGSRRDPLVRRLVRHRSTGWLHDPEGAAPFGLALADALETPARELAAMREAARSRIGELVAQTDAERLHTALSALLPATAPRPGIAVLQQPSGAQPAAR